MEYKEHIDRIMGEVHRWESVQNEPGTIKEKGESSKLLRQRIETEIGIAVERALEDGK